MAKNSSDNSKRSVHCGRDESGLTEKLRKVAALEEQHNISGVSFATRKGARILAEDAVDYVIEAIESGIRILDGKEYVVVSKPAPPR